MSRFRSCTKNEVRGETAPDLRSDWRQSGRSERRARRRSDLAPPDELVRVQGQPNGGHGAAIGCVVGWYALKALYGFALTGTKPVEETRSEEERAARHVADAVRAKPDLPPPDDYPSKKPPDDYPKPSVDLPTSTGDVPPYMYARNTLL